MEKDFNKLFEALKKMAGKKYFSVHYERSQHFDESAEVEWSGYIADRGNWSKTYSDPNKVSEYFRDQQTDPN